MDGQTMTSGPDDTDETIPAAFESGEYVGAYGEALETLVPCPLCAACPVCHGACMVTPAASTKWKSEHPPKAEE
jgi:radical SAM protein with 4Fe4S-binding SPASM domain